MRTLIVSLACTAALAVAALLPATGQAYPWPYSYGYYAPAPVAAANYYYGSYYYPSTAYYYPSTAYYAPSTAYYSGALSYYYGSPGRSDYYYGADSPTTTYYYPRESASIANYYYPYAATVDVAPRAAVRVAQPYTYGAYVPPAAAYYAEPAPTVAVVPTEERSIANVGIQNDRFEPRTITINAGSTVRWTNNGTQAHTVTSDTNAFDSGELSARSTFSHTFDRPGTYYYHCNIEPNKMRAEVIVK